MWEPNEYNSIIPWHIHGIRTKHIHGNFRQLPSLPWRSLPCWNHSTKELKRLVFMASEADWSHQRNHSSSEEEKRRGRKTEGVTQCAVAAATWVLLVNRSELHLSGRREWGGDDLLIPHSSPILHPKSHREIPAKCLWKAFPPTSWSEFLSWTQNIMLPWLTDTSEDLTSMIWYQPPEFMGAAAAASPAKNHEALLAPTHSTAQTPVGISVPTGYALPIIQSFLEKPGRTGGSKPASSALASFRSRPGPLSSDLPSTIFKSWASFGIQNQSVVPCFELAPLITILLLTRRTTPGTGKKKKIVG